MPQLVDQCLNWLIILWYIYDLVSWPDWSIFRNYSRMPQLVNNTSTDKEFGFWPLLTFNEKWGQNDVAYDASGSHMSMHAKNHVAGWFS